MTTTPDGSQAETDWIVKASQAAVTVFWRRAATPAVRKSYGVRFQLLSYAWERIQKAVADGDIEVGRSKKDFNHAIRLGVWACIDGLRSETNYRAMKRHGIKRAGVSEIRKIGLFGSRNDVRDYALMGRKHRGLSAPGEGLEFESLADSKSQKPDSHPEDRDETERLLFYAKSIHAELMETIVVLYYGLRGVQPMTMHEIGKRIGMSESRVSQLHSDYIEYVKSVKEVSA